MTLREFVRFHLLKALLIFIVIQLAVIAFVQNYDHRPVAEADQVSVPSGHNVKIAPLDNDKDKDETDELSLKQVNSPEHGVTEQRQNILYYTPNKGFTGKDSLTYTISDGKKESKPAYIVIQVDQNLPPIAKNDTVEAYSGRSAVFDVLRNDTDREQDSIFIREFTQPIYGKLQLTGNSLAYTADHSAHGADSFMYSVSDGFTVSEQAKVLINIKPETDPCYPWLSSDIGDAAIPGSFTCANNTFTIKASGSDIWNNFDGFHYAYQYVSGDCEMYTKVESLEGTHEWTKAGVMARETLNGGSKMAFVCVTTGNGVTSHQRTTAGGGAEGGDRDPDKKAPYWVKLVRKGDTFSYYVAPDGKSWKKMDEADVPMTKNIYIGFAVTNHDNSNIGTGVFSNFHLTGKVAKF